MSEFKPEENTSNCKVCGAVGKRITVHKYDAKNYKYIDEDGKAWCGKKCPKCHREQMRLRMQEKRKRKKEDDELAKAKT